MSSENLHEDPAHLSDETINRHRAIVSLIEELDAVDWYSQRAEACTDPALQAILLHNRNEEIEHACMVLEWLRRGMPEMDRNLREYLFTTGDVTRLEAEKPGEAPSNASSGPAPAGTGPAPRFTVGDLKGDEHE